MPTLLSEIVHELSSNNPKASPEEMSHALIKILEYDVLPNAIRNMDLPSPPSPAQIWQERMRLQRAKKKFRKPSFLKQKGMIIQQFETVKYQLNGDKEGYTSVPSFSVSDFTDPSTTVSRWTDKSYVKEVLLEKDGISLRSELTPSRHKKPSRFELTKPSPMLIEDETKRIFQFDISETIQEKILFDPLFREIVGAIETRLMNFAIEHQYKMDSYIFIRTDIEIPSWEKIILNIDMPERNFDQKMILWDKIDEKIRQVLLELKHEDTSFEHEIEAINLRLFTKMKL